MIMVALPVAGSIPACAGEPQSHRLRYPAVGVYPRVCGGTTMGIEGTTPGTGLSPRVRGNRAVNPPPPAPPRSIPACAGEPRVITGLGTMFTVYPRVCGGTPSKRWPTSSGSGLSPRVRGNPEVLRLAARPLRSIPACAGEPGNVLGKESMARVYPRVCGGTASLVRIALTWGGLSPRVRGNPTRLDRLPQYLRSIPACAGEPAAHGGQRC